MINHGLMATYDKYYFVNRLSSFRICNKLIVDRISCHLPCNSKTGNGKAKLVFPSYVFDLKTPNDLYELQLLPTRVNQNLSCCLRSTVYTGASLKSRA